VLVDEEKMFAFFDSRIPADIVNGHGFEKWRRAAEQENPKALFMTRDDLMRHGAESVTEELFPKTMAVGEVECKLSYRFEPGHPLDGVMLTVPLHLLNRLDEKRSGWLVPGMIRDKVTALIKGLPKKIRGACVPVPDFVTGFLDAAPSLNSLPFKGRAGVGMGSAVVDATPIPHLTSPLKGEGQDIGDVTTALATYIKKKTGQDIGPDDWRIHDLPPHLRMYIRVVDEAGLELAAGRDLAELKQKLGQAAQMTFAQEAPTEHEQTGLTQWSFGTLPEKIAFKRGGHQLTGYPALVDEGETAAIRLFDTPAAALEAHRGGVRRLLWLALKEQMKQLEKNIPNFNQIALQARTVMSADKLRTDLLACIADRAFISDDALPRTDKEFAKQRDRAKTRLPAVAQGAAKLAAEIFTEWHAIQARLGAKLPYPLVSDIREQLVRLVYDGLFAATPWEHLQHLPRYLKAILQRIDKYAANPERDARHAAGLKEWQQKFEERLEKQRKAGSVDPKLMDFRWMLEEMRVSLFAQGLRTPYPISWKRLEKVWSELAG